MKRVYVNLMLCLLFGTLWSCYKDEGNYDYKNLPEIKFEEYLAIWDDETEEYVPQYLGSYKIGEEMHLRPNITWTNVSDDMHLKYTWSIDGKKVIGTEEVLRWKTDTLGRFYLVLDIEDEEHGTHFMKDYYFTVEALYEGWGFLVLSEKDGEKILSFFNMSTHTNVPLDKMEVDAHIDLYGQVNGMPLPTNTFKIMEYYRKSNERKSQLLALAPNTFVDFDAFSFKYLGNAAPYLQEPINDIRNLVMMQYVDMIETEEGKLYQRRKTTNGVFHYGKFLKAPIEYYNREGKMEVLEDMRLIPGNCGSSRNFILTLDDKNKRYLAISDSKDRDWNNYVDYITAGQICEVGYTSGRWPEGITPLDDLEGCEVLYTGSRNQGEWTSLNYVSVLKQDGRYYYQEFDINGNTNISDGYSVTATSVKQTDLPGKLASVINENSLFCVVDDNGFSYNSTHPWLYVAVDKDLYLCNLSDDELTDGSIFGPLTFDSKITAMNGKCYGGGYLAVGLENGEFFIIRNDQAKNHWTWAEKDPSDNYYGLILYHIPTGELGKIIDIQYKDDGYGAQWQ